VAAAIPISKFKPDYPPGRTGHQRDKWRSAKPNRFSSDMTGFKRLRGYLDRWSTHSRDFLILLEPTGGFYGLNVLMYLINAGYTVFQVENRAVKDYREKTFSSESKTDDTDARLMARMRFLHEVVGEEFSIQPVHLANPDYAAVRDMAHDYVKVPKEITRRLGQLQQVAALTFPELKTFFKYSTSAPSLARSLSNDQAAGGGKYR
jgi:transposase